MPISITVECFSVEKNENKKIVQMKVTFGTTLETFFIDLGYVVGWSPDMARSSVMPRHLCTGGRA